jgi:hypothetical protein
MSKSKNIAFVLRHSFVIRHSSVLYCCVRAAKNSDGQGSEVCPSRQARDFEAVTGHLTKTRSATAGEGELNLKWTCRSHWKVTHWSGQRLAASRGCVKTQEWLQTGAQKTIKTSSPKIKTLYTRL